MTSASYSGQQGRPYDSPALPSRPAQRREAGLPGFASVVLIVVMSGLGAAFDLATGTGLRTGYGVTFVVGCALAALLVQKRHRLWPVFAPSFIFAGTAFLAALNGRDWKFTKIGTGSDTMLRLIGPGKAPYLLVGVALAAGIAGYRHYKDR